MFERLNAPKQDPILGLTLAIMADQRSDKMDPALGSIATPRVPP